MRELLQNEFSGRKEKLYHEKSIELSKVMIRERPIFKHCKLTTTELLRRPASRQDKSFLERLR